MPASPWILAAALATAGALHAEAHIVYAAGDIARCTHTAPRWTGAADTALLLAGRLAGEPDAHVLALGDNVYEAGSDADYARCYDPTWGRFKKRTWPAPGNREYRTPGAAGYFRYFGAVAGPGYYTVSLGVWRLFSLDSNLSGAAHAAQLAWLRQQLASSSARCTLAYWHHPLYSSGGHGSLPHMKDVWQALYEAGADIVLSGHDHDYERFAGQDADGRLDPARGIRQFVVGTGGAFPTPLTPWPQAHSEARDSNHLGVLRLRLRDDAYEWEFLAAGDGSPDGWTPDRGAARCHQPR